MGYGVAHMAATGGSSNARWRARAGAGLVETGGLALARASENPPTTVMALRWTAITAPAVLVCLAGLVAVFGRQPWIFVVTGLIAMSIAALIDIAAEQIPDPLVVGTGVAALGGWVMTDAEIAQVLTGSLFMGLPVLAVHLVSPSAMGFGDVKATLVLGALVGLVQATAALLGLAVATATMAVVGIASGRRSVPLGPGLVIGAAVAWVWSSRFTTGDW